MDRITPLMLAAQAGRVDVLRALMAAGCDVAARDRGDNAALGWAKCYMVEESVDLLLNALAQPLHFQPHKESAHNLHYKEVRSVHGPMGSLPVPFKIYTTREAASRLPHKEDSPPPLLFGRPDTIPSRPSPSP